MSPVWPDQRAVIGALGVYASLLGGVLLALADAIGSGRLGVIGAVALIGGVLLFFVTAVKRSRREGRGLIAALVSSTKDALRLAWCVFKNA